MVRAPHTTGEHVESGGGGAPDVFGGGVRPAPGRTSSAALIWAWPVGGDQRGEEGHEQEERGDREGPVISMPFCQPTATRSSLMIGILGPERRLGADVELGIRSSPGTVILSWDAVVISVPHLGSISAAMTSTRKLTTATMMAI